MCVVLPCVRLRNSIPICVTTHFLSLNGACKRRPALLDIISECNSIRCQLLLNPKRTCISLITARIIQHIRNTWAWRFPQILFCVDVCRLLVFYRIRSATATLTMLSFMHEVIYTEFNERLLWMNCVVKVKERERRSKVKSWVNERICTRWVRLAASRRLTRISCRRQQSAATTKQRDEIKEENVIRCDFLLLKPQSVYEDLAFVGCDRVQSRMKTKNRRLYIHRMMLWGSEWEGNENLSFKFISIVVISSYSNLGTKGFWLFAHRKLLKRRFKTSWNEITHSNCHKLQLDDNDDDALLSIYNELKLKLKLNRMQMRWSISNKLNTFEMTRDEKTHLNRAREAQGSQIIADLLTQSSE